MACNDDSDHATTTCLTRNTYNLQAPGRRGSLHYCRVLVACSDKSKLNMKLTHSLTTQCRPWGTLARPDLDVHVGSIELPFFGKRPDVNHAVITARHDHCAAICRDRAHTPIERN